MSYEANTGNGLQNHYGPRGLGTGNSSVVSVGMVKTLKFAYGPDNLHIPHTIPENSVILNVDLGALSTGVVTIATVGAVDISGAISSTATFGQDIDTDAVNVPLGGAVVLSAAGVDAAAQAVATALLRGFVTIVYKTHV